MRRQSLRDSGASPRERRGGSEARTGSGHQSSGAVLSPIHPKYPYLTKFIQKPPADKNTMLDYLPGRSDDEMSIMKSCDFLSTLTTTYNWMDKNVTSIKPESVEEFDLIYCQF